MKVVKNLMPYIVGVIIIIFLLYKFVFFMIVVPSASMYPTIKIGDRIATTRIYDLESVKRGDILVFYSKELHETMVKRVIGLPNDSVLIDEEGEVFINNEKLEEPYVKYPDNKSGSFKVPEGEYFFLGDARDHSYDSRSWEDPYIPEDDILGKAQIILFPFSRISVMNGRY